MAPCWADVAGAWVAETLLGVEGDVDHLARGGVGDEDRGVAPAA